MVAWDGFFLNIYKIADRICLCEYMTTISIFDGIANILPASDIGITTAAILVISGFLGILIFRYVVENHIRPIVRKTKTDVDDFVLSILERFAEYMIILLSFYLAARSIAWLQPYYNLVDGAAFVAAIVLITSVIRRIISFFIPRFIHLAHKKSESSLFIITRVLDVILYMAAALIGMAYFNIEITPIITAFGIGSLAVGLALQDSLANFFAGIYIASASPIRIGNFIEIPGEGISGYVEDIGWRDTRVRTLANTLMIVPNSTLSKSIVSNTSLPNKEISVPVECGVSYRSDLDKVEAITREVILHIQQTTPEAEPSFSPIFRFHTFGDSNILFTVILRAREYEGSFNLKHVFIKALKKRFDMEGIEIAFPTRTIYMYSSEKAPSNARKR